MSKELSEEKAKELYAFMVKCYCEKRGIEVTNIKIVRRDEAEIKQAETVNSAS